MESRQGRNKQRYAVDGSRLVAGVVAVSSDKRKVLIVESVQRKNHWVLPKGGYETDEPSAEDAASREAWEEAGITGHIGRSLGEIRDKRTGPHTLYYFFEFRVEREEPEWPEMHKRKRCWMTYKEATECFRIMNRPELQEAIDRSSLSR